MSDEAPQNSAPGRTLPHSLESEEFLLSLCLLDGNDIMARCILAGITPFSFYDTKHGIVFERLLDLYNRQRPIAIEILAEELKTAKQLDAVGGYAFLTQVSSRIPTTAQAGYFISKVKELATLRAVIRACTANVEDCYNFTGDLDQLSTTISERVTKAVGNGRDESEETIQETAKQIYAEITAPPTQRPKPVGEVSWGLVDIDQQCGRMHAGNLIVLAGMPSTGKSALADAVAWKNARMGEETLLFTYEMSKRDKAIRIAQQTSRLNFDHLNTAPTDMRIGFLEQMKAIVDCKTLHVFERDLSVNRIQARARSFINRGKKVGLIVVDFLQYLARLEPSIGRERTDEKIGRMTAGLKQLARECECPALLLSSINRDGYKEGNRPTMANLKASGEIESDADVVAILHWPKINPKTNDEQDPHSGDQNLFYVEFNQDKGRSKGVQQVGLSFDRHITRFDNYQR
jgi:replicative DNA helicase